MKTIREPKTLQEAVVHFADDDNALNYVASRRWPDGAVICPTCGRDDVTFLQKQRKWQCKSQHKKRQFSVKVGTIFEGSPIGLDKWLCAVWMVTNCKNGVSSYEIHRALGVTQKTAWFMLQRIRLAMQDEKPQKKLFKGTVEADETYIGGLARNMHKSKKAEKVHGTGGLASGKTVVHGLLERNERKHASTIRVAVVANARRKTVQKRVKDNVELWIGRVYRCVAVLCRARI